MGALFHVGDLSSIRTTASAEWLVGTAGGEHGYLTCTGLMVPTL